MAEQRECRLWLWASLGSNLGSASYQLWIEGVVILLSLHFRICGLEIQVPSAFPKFMLGHFALMKDLHECLVLPTERNRKRIFSLLGIKARAKTAFSACFPACTWNGQRHRQARSPEIPWAPQHQASRALNGVRELYELGKL